MRFEISDPEEMHELGLRLGRALAAGDLVVLTGPLGAGKTTLTRGIGEGLGVRGPVQSPTFVLARTHPSLVGGAPLVHLDAYRLSGAAELDDLDIDFEGSVVVAEWGAGLVEEGDSWIEVVIERPTGVDAAAGAEAAAEGSAAKGSAEGSGAGGSAAEGSAADEGLDLSEEPVEPRVVTLTGYGPRWREGLERALDPEAAAERPGAGAREEDGARA